MLEYLAYDGFSALAVEEGRSFMEIGKQVMGANVSIWDDGNDPTGLPTATDFEGVAKQRVDLVTDGVATRPGPRLGHRPPRRGDLDRPCPAGAEYLRAAGLEPVHVAGHRARRRRCCRRIDRGLWVTRFHYVNIVHPRGPS